MTTGCALMCLSVWLALLVVIFSAIRFSFITELKVKIFVQGNINAAYFVATGPHAASSLEGLRPGKR